MLSKSCNLFQIFNSALIADSNMKTNKMNFLDQANITSKINGIKGRIILNFLTFKQMRYKTTPGRQTILDLGVYNWVENKL
jgi:hypothetical protein